MFRRIDILVACTVALVSAPPLLAQAVGGRLVDAETGEPVQGASVALWRGADRVAEARSTTAGGFHVPVGVTGEFRLKIRRLGYRPDTSRVLTVGMRDTLLAEIRLSPTPTLLGPTVTFARGGREWGQDGFAERQGREKGVFLTRDDILASDPLHFHDIFDEVEGLQVGYALNGAPEIRALRGRRCLRFFVNRLPLRSSIPLPHQIMGIEIYRDSRELPDEFRNEVYPCGMVNVWTPEGWAPR